MCAPKGAAFLHVRRDLQPVVRPLVISHGANSPRTDRSRYLIEFDWVGTDDPTAVLCVPEAIRFMGSASCPAAGRQLRSRNRVSRCRVASSSATHWASMPPCPDEMIGSLASVPLPDGDGRVSNSPLYADPLQDLLLGSSASKSR